MLPVLPSALSPCRWGCFSSSCLHSWPGQGRARSKPPLLPPQHLPRQPPNPPPPVAAEQTTAEQGDGTRTLLMMLSRSTVSRSVLSDSATGWTATHQAPLSMGFSRREYWSGLPFPSPEDLSDPGIKHGSSSLQADS